MAAEAGEDAGLLVCGHPGLHDSSPCLVELQTPRGHMRPCGSGRTEPRTGMGLGHAAEVVAEADEKTGWVVGIEARTHAPDWVEARTRTPDRVGGNQNPSHHGKGIRARPAMAMAAWKGLGVSC